jgi:hypothetical protein
MQNLHQEFQFAEVLILMPMFFWRIICMDNRLGFNYGIFHRKYLFFASEYFYKSSSKHLITSPEWLTINYNQRKMKSANKGEEGISSLGKRTNWRFKIIFDFTSSNN